MKLAVIGSSGFLGSYLTATLGAQTTRLDLTQTISASFKDVRYVIICAAITDVEKCFQDQILSRQVNVVGTQNLLKAAKAAGAIPVFFSSDYVFSGTRSHQENDRREPTTTYGRQKAEIEDYLESNFQDFLIFRTSKLMSKTAHPRSILFGVISALSRGEPIKCFQDQWINPVFIEDIAEILKRAFAQNLTETYHLGTKRIFSRLELAKFLATSLDYDLNLIQPTPMSTVRTSEPRPTHNLLNCDKIGAILGFRFTEVEDAISDLRTLNNPSSVFSLNTKCVLPD